MPIQKSLTDVTRIQPLTSVERVLYHIDPDNSLGMTIKAQRTMQAWIASVSSNVQRYLNRELIIKQRVEYFDSVYNKSVYRLGASPVWDIDSVYIDTSGKFDGGETYLHPDNYYITSDQSGLVIDGISLYNDKRAIKITYTAGMAYHPTHTVMEGANSFTIGMYVIGTLGAMGKVVSRDDAGFTIDVLAGIFDESDTITEYESLDTQISTGESATIDAISSRALCELYPDITEAVELQIRYMHAHKDDFENNSTNREGETLRRSDSATANLQAEARMLLDPYRKLTLFA